MPRAERCASVVRTFEPAPLPASLPAPPGSRLLKRTQSRCPACLLDCPAEVSITAEEPPRIFLERVCPEHGAFSACISSDARFYWLSRGHPENQTRGCGPSICCAADGQAAGTAGANASASAGPCETLSTCLALIEIVDSCNLRCPTCYAGSAYTGEAEPAAKPLPDLKARIEGVIARKGKIEILQLSGGEPTLYPEFFDLVEWIQDHPGIDYLLVNTNGVRLATDPSFARKLEAVSRRRRVQLYLQFDGTALEGQAFLRGADLRRTREKALSLCRQMQLPVTLAMTVTHENLANVWPTVSFGLSQPHVRGVTFQPFFQTGRFPAGNGQADRPRTRLNTADIILALVSQSAGQIGFDDFTPLPCGDPNCATIGYLLKTPGGICSLSEFIDFRQIQGFLRDRLRYSLGDLERCGCESEPLGALLKQMEMDESKTFRLLIKPFMDAWSWDQDRIDRCCTHVIRPDGKLDSFCRYYSGGADA